MFCRNYCIYYRNTSVQILIVLICSLSRPLLCCVLYTVPKFLHKFPLLLKQSVPLKYMCVNKATVGVGRKWQWKIFPLKSQDWHVWFSFFIKAKWDFYKWCQEETWSGKMSGDKALPGREGDEGASGFKSQLGWTWIWNWSPWLCELAGWGCSPLDQYL